MRRGTATPWLARIRPLLQPSPRPLEKNNLDLLRLLFAGTVCLVHTYELSGFQQLKWITGLFSSAVAVKAFFVVSGFLIVMSFERSSSWLSYARKRIRRIYPAYAAVVLLCALGLFLASSKSGTDYFSMAWLRHVLANLAFLNFLQPTLPGVFDANPVAAVNGALWTLKIEVLFYLSVPALVFLFRRYSPLPVLALVYGLSVGYGSLLAMLADRTGAGIYLELGRQLPGQLAYFMAGAFFFYFLPLFMRYRVRFLFAALLVLALNMAYPLRLLEPFALATLVAFFGLSLYWGNFGKFGDFSYGVYILHFPIIQLLLQTGWFRESPWYFLLTAVEATALGAVSLWHLIEKRFLLHGSHYLAAIAPPPGDATRAHATAAQ